MFKNVCIRSKNLNVFKKKSETSSENNESLRSTRLSSEGIDFDFENLCFICCTDASDAFINKQKKSTVLSEMWFVSLMIIA